MDKIILTDCDGVLTNWELAFHVWMKERGCQPIRNDIYEMAERYGKSKEEMKDLIKFFNESAAIGFLPPLRDAMRYVKKLHEEHGYVFRVITSLSLDPYAKRLRVSNLEKLFGTAIDDVICLDTGADKVEALEKYRDSYMYWIEDKPENARVGQKMGLTSILIEHEHNRNEKGILLAKNWKQVYEMIMNGE